MMHAYGIHFAGVSGHFARPSRPMAREVPARIKPSFRPNFAASRTSRMWTAEIKPA